MRKQLLCAAAAVAVLYGTTRPAYALFGVGDIVFDPAVYGEVVQEAKTGLQELQWLSDIYGTAQKDLQVLTNFYNLFAHITDATQLAQVLNSEFVKSPMLGQAIQLEQTFRGLGLQTSLAGKINTIMRQVSYYAPPKTDFSGYQINQALTGTAGQISSARDAYDAEKQRVTGLAELMLGINTADPKKVQDLTARGTIETAQAISAGNQLAAASIMQKAAQDTLREQQEQAYRFDTDQLQARATAAAQAAEAGQVNLITP